MKDLTPAQEAELAGDLLKFIEDRAFDGLSCVVIINGRGICKVAYSREIAADAPSILARAYRQVRDNNAGKLN